MNLPNQLTVFRLILTAIFVAVLSGPAFDGKYTLGLLLFVLAAITDFLDGYLARKLDLITNFGKLMDPLADKVMVMAGFVLLVELGKLPAWAVIIILTREFLVTGLRLVAASHGRVMAAEALGKHKTIWQMITLIYFLLSLTVVESAMSWLAPLFTWEITSTQVMGNLLLAIVLTLTIWSGISYLAKNWQVIQD